MDCSAAVPSIEKQPAGQVTDEGDPGDDCVPLEAAAAWAWSNAALTLSMAFLCLWEVIMQTGWRGKANRLSAQ